MFLFWWVHRCRRTELARRVVIRRRQARKRRFRCYQEMVLSQKLLLVPRIERRTLRLRRRSRRIWRKPRSTNWWENIVLKTFTSQDWLDNFRMRKDTFMYLCNQLKCALNKTDTRMRNEYQWKNELLLLYGDWLQMWSTAVLATSLEYRDRQHA